MSTNDFPAPLPADDTSITQHLHAARQELERQAQPEREPQFFVSLEAHGFEAFLQHESALRDLFDPYWLNKNPHPGPLALAEITKGPQGHRPTLGDVSNVCAVAIRVYPCDDQGTPRTIATCTDDLRARLPFDGVVYSTSNHLHDGNYIIILWLDRPYSVEEQYRIREWVRERYFDDATVEYLDPNETVEPPTFSLAAFNDERVWSDEFFGPLLSAEMVPEGFMPKVSFTPLPAAAGEARVKAAIDAETEGTHLLALLRKQPVYEIMAGHAGLRERLLQPLVTNLAPLIRATSPAGREARSRMRERVLSAIEDLDNELYPAGAGWSQRVSAALDAELHIRWDAPAQWKAFYERGLPRSVGGLTAHALGDLRQLAEQNGINPRDWLFIGTLGQWFRRKADGTFEDDGLSQQAVTHLLGKMLPGGRGDVGVRHFLEDAIHVYKRDAVFSSRLEIVEHEGHLVQNLYRASEVQPRRGMFPNIDKLLRNVVGSERTDDAVEYVKDWCAGVLQGINIGVPFKWLTYLTFIGPPGSGKSTLVDIFALLVGERNVIRFDQKRLESQFFPVKPNTLLLVGNEVHASDHDETDVANHIKRIVTDRTLMAERKHVDAGEIPNRVNLIITTNNDRAVKLDRDDRRATVFASERRLDPALATAIQGDLAHGHAELAAFFYALLRRNVKRGRDELFETKARRDLISRSQSRLDAFAERLRDEGFSVLFQEYADHCQTVVPATHHARDANGVERVHVLSETLLDVARHHCPAARGREVSSKALQGVIEKVLPKLGKTRVRVRADREALTVLTGLPISVKDDGTPALVSGDPSDKSS